MFKQPECEKHCELSCIGEIVHPKMRLTSILLTQDSGVNVWYCPICKKTKITEPFYKNWKDWE